MAHVRSQRKSTYVLRVTRSCFLEWVWREMVTWIGHVEMGTGREKGGGGVRVQKWGWRGMQAVVRGRQGGQSWLTDACRGKWGKVDRKEGGNGKRRGAAVGDGEGGQEGGGQWEGGISVMKCLGGHTFPEQRRVTKLVIQY